MLPVSSRTFLEVLSGEEKLLSVHRNQLFFFKLRPSKAGKHPRSGAGGGEWPCSATAEETWGNSPGNLEKPPKIFIYSHFSPSCTVCGLSPTTVGKGLLSSALALEFGDLQISTEQLQNQQSSQLIIRTLPSSDFGLPSYLNEAV